VQKYTIKRLFLWFYHSTMKKIIIILALLCSGCVWSQKQQKAIEATIDAFARTLYTQPDSAFFYISKAKLESAKIKDNFLLSRCWYNLGFFYNSQNNVAKAENCFYQSLPFAKKSKNYKVQIKANSQLALIAMNRSDYSDSLKKLLLALSVSEKNMMPENTCDVLIDLGSLYDIQNNSPKALDYYQQSEKVALENNYRDGLLSSYNNIAILKRKTDKKLAITYYKKAYALAKELNLETEQFNLLINLSDVYLDFKDKESMSNAHNCLIEAEQKALKTGNFYNLFFVYFNLGGYHKQLKNYPEAVQQYQKAVALSKNGIPEDQKINLYKALSRTYVAMGDYAQGYAYNEKYHVGQDSIFSVAKSKGFQDIQTKYEVDKKNLKIKLLTKEKLIEVNRKKFILSAGVGLLGLFLIVLFFFWQRIKTQKIIRAKENLLFLEEKKRLQSEQELERITGVLEGQEQERNRVAQEIHDGVGGKLAGIKLQLSQINSSINSEPLTALTHHLGDLFGELRSISHNMSLNFIQNKALELLLAELAQEYENRNEFKVDLIVFPAGSLNEVSMTIKHQLYRVVQELLANISKHARAKNVSINITNYEDNLNLIFEDDGCGFDTKITKGIGLKNIEERLLTINGKITIESIKERGTTVIVDILTPNTTTL
jgi:two-component system, NarL family, sensor kinase